MGIIARTEQSWFPTMSGRPTDIVIALILSQRRRVLMRNWYQRVARRVTSRPPIRRTATQCRLTLERLDDRCLPSATSVFQQTNLVSDQPGVAQITDPNLVNPWGIALGPNGGTLWVSDNGTGMASLFRGGVNGSPFIQNPGLTEVSGLGAPTGQVFNGTSDFVIRAANGDSAPALFIFVSEDGTITAWNPNVPKPAPSSQAQLAVDVPDAVFKGVTIASDGANNFLFATDFHNGKVDVFDKNFAPVAEAKGAFTDRRIPAGFAPFNVQNIGGRLFVTFAQQDAARHDNVDGPGKGFVDVFDVHGNLEQRLASRGTLNSPWGLALAPAGFGKFGGDLLVGNFGDGHINAFDPTTGQFVGVLRAANGQPVAIPGLWGLAFGNGVTVGDKGTLFFNSGPDGETHGLFGSLKPVDVDVIAVGSNVGGVATVNVFDAATHTPKFTITPFGTHFHGEVRVAVGDVNGDGIPDVIAGTGPGVTNEVRVFDGRTGRPLPGALGDFTPFAGKGGVFVAAGDVNGDGNDDVIVGADAGQAPVVEVVSGATGHLLDRFLAASPQFRGGIRVAAGDVNGDGKADIITGLGAGASPEVSVFDGVDASLMASFLAGAPTFHGGVFVAAGDVNGDGLADIIVGQGQGGKPQVQVFSGVDFTLQGSFLAADPGFTGGVRVATATVGGQTVIATGLGQGGGPQVGLFDGATLQSLGTIPGLGPNFRGGIFVG
jgi:uncharacterized protein (TIGR03118 family)